MVLFITGICHNPSFCGYYCPLSENRKNIDQVWANDRPVVGDDDVLKEVRRMDALGAGFTGGDPLLRKDRVLHYLDLLKSEFGPRFHVHLYTSSGPHLTVELFGELRDAGLDEIRFHLPETEWEKIRLAHQESLQVGAEVPAVNAEYLKKLISFLDSLDGVFLNINELEMCEPNAEELIDRNFLLKEDSIAGVAGSEEIALTVMEWARSNSSLPIHYCPSILKDSVQFKNRMLRTAKLISKPYESITSEGLLYLGIIESFKTETIHEALNLLLTKYHVPDDLIYLNEKQSRIELDWEVLQELANELKEMDWKCGFVEELPNHSRLRISYDPI